MDEYDRFCAGIARLTAVDLTYYKRHQVERRSRGMATRAGASDLDAYLTLLRDDAARLDDFMARMTITVSQLWRNPEIFDVIGDELLPQLTVTTAATRLRLWCAGCSYGAEAYTLAAVCLEHAALLAKPPIIVASDVNARMIERARRGTFSADDARDAPPAVIERHFERDAAGDVHASAQLKRMIRFEHEDLLRAKHRAMHLILCRNVSIHFTRDARDRLHAALAGALAPGGMLVLGSTEMIVRPGELGLERVRPFVFRRPPTGDSAGTRFPAR